MSDCAKYAIAKPTDFRRNAVEALIAKHGGYKAAAAVLGITRSYLWRIANGQRHPSEEVLKKLKLQRRIEYVWK